MPKRDLYDDIFGEAATDELNSVPITRIVPNVQPKINTVPYRLALIGETPGADEVSEGIPFVGWSGRELNKLLSKFGVFRDACFIGNICQHRPPGNKIALFDWDGPQITEGLAKLKNDLALFEPNLVLCLGGSALHAFKNPNIIPKKRKSPDGFVFAFPDSIGDWRGSFFVSHPDSPCPLVKCMAAYHPAACLRQYEWTPLLALDLHRAIKDATTKTLDLPERNLVVNLSLEETLNELRKVAVEKPLISIDIEGGIDTMSCISVATSPSYSFIVPFTKANGSPFYDNPDEELLIWRALTAILGDKDIPKVLQNSLYDRFVLQYSYKIIVRGVVDDTMLEHWELHCELEKSLGFQCSIYTREPFYKSDRKSNDRDTFFRYCCRDSAVTYEINEKMKRSLSGPALAHYRFNVDLLNPLLYMELRGIRYDKAGAKQRLKEVKNQIYELQYEIDKVAGYGVTGQEEKQTLVRKLREVCCYKRDQNRPKAEFRDSFDSNLRTLLGPAPLSKAEIGRLNTDLGLGLNTKGAEVKKFLYETLALPEQRHPETKALTTDYLSLLKLYKKTKHPAILLVIDIGELRTRAQMLEMKVDEDGRVRCSYNQFKKESGKDSGVGITSTGRLACSKSLTGSGTNLQTIPDIDSLKPEGHPLRQGMRDLLVADADCYLCKCDLKGADGWTVGAHLSSLGAPAMLQDLVFGIKPAARLCYMVRHGSRSLAGKQRDEVKQLLREVKGDDWDYFAFKQCIWGFCYLMGVEKAVSHVLKVSQGTVVMEAKVMKTARDALFDFYNVTLWHKATEKKLLSQPYPPKLTSSSGLTREFFGRKNEILGEALAHEPQNVTTHATNKAVFNCWTDRENRMPSMCVPNGDKLGSSNKLRVEPLHQVHDEFLTQFKIVDTPWAIDKLKSWFATPIVIAGVQVTIPFEGNYGTNWAMDEHSKVGSI